MIYSLRFRRNCEDGMLEDHRAHKMQRNGNRPFKGENRKIWKGPKNDIELIH